MFEPLRFKFVEVGECWIHDCDEDHDPPRWRIVVEDTIGTRRRRSYDLDGSYETPGQAIDAALEWARQRGLTVDFPRCKIYRKEPI